MLCLWVSRNGLLFFNGSWTTFYGVLIVRMYIWMILLLVPRVIRHNCDVRAVFDRLRREELVASVSRTDFWVRSVDFCGHVLENGTRGPATVEMGTLQRLTKLDSVRELRGFLGLANYFFGYVQNYASIGTTLIEMLTKLPKHKNGKKIGLTWNASANEASLKLKRAITDIVPLQLADWDEDFVLGPDSTSWVVGAAL